MKLISKKRSLFIYDYFFPGFKAGGPIQSLTNLILHLEENSEIYFITSGYDHGEITPYPDLKLNTWTKVLLPGAHTPINVWYNDNKGPPKKTLKKLIEDIDPEHIYLNGIYSLHYFLLPLMAVKALGFEDKVIICPRGMLQRGALEVRSLKKKIYLTVLRGLGLVKKVRWHATNQQEKEDIAFHFKGNNEIIVAENIPKKPIKNITFPTKKRDELKLIYLSLISEKKNLLLLLQALNPIKPGLSLEVYGPPKDVDYWHKCEDLIKTIPNKVKYMGNVKPAYVQQVISAAQVFVLPTKGENFGHALYESLSVGRPVITSNFTPWNNLEQHKAGINVDIVNDEELILAMEKFKAMDQREYDDHCKGAYQMACNYFNSLDLAVYNDLLFAN